jgi:hypothetical protein
MERRGVRSLKALSELRASARFCARVRVVCARRSYSAARGDGGETSGFAAPRWLGPFT